MRAEGAVGRRKFIEGAMALSVVAAWPFGMGSTVSESQVFEVTGCCGFAPEDVVKIEGSAAYLGSGYYRVTSISRGRALLEPA